MALILDEQQIRRLHRSKIKRRRGRAVKVSAKVDLKFRRAMSALWREILLPTAAQVKEMVRANAPASEIASVIERALASAEANYDIQADDLVTQWQMGIDSESRKALRKGLSHSLGVDVSALVDTPQISEAMSLGSTEASRLIKRIPGDYLHQVSQAVSDNFAGVPQPDNRSLLEQIIHIGKVSKKRAHLIARDQTSKLTSTINKTRQTSIGISTYIWRHANDTRVVGKPGGVYPEGSKLHRNHWIMGGLYCQWADNTVYSRDKGNTWLKRKPEMARSIPGWEIQCRCYAEPVIDIDAILKYSSES